MSEKVAAVVVTYNRFSLLCESVNALRQQKRRIDTIIVVNNGSTDQTEAWLNDQKDLITITQDNQGGAGGFYTGIKHAVSLNVDWIWLMDDDTICLPDTLQESLHILNCDLDEEIGFISSKCLWLDGNPHYMNITEIGPYFNNLLPFNKYDRHKVLLVEECSFVSVLINAKAIKKVGLPYKEFFIWGDDIEYTRRISELGYLGLYALDSNVIHKTPSNYRPNYFTEPVSTIWKHTYGLRNKFFLVRKKKGFLFYLFWMPSKVIYTSLQVAIKRKEGRRQYISSIIKAGWQSVFFNPKIDHV